MILFKLTTVQKIDRFLANNSVGTIVTIPDELHIYSLNS